MALGSPIGSFRSTSIGQDKGRSRRFIGEGMGGQMAQQNNAAQQSMDAYSGYYAPDMQAARNQADRARATLPFQSSYYDNQRGGLYGENDIANRGIGLQEQGLGIDRNANNRDAAYYQNLLNILGQQRDIVGMEFTNTRQQLQDRAATDVRGTNQQATAGGSWLAPERMAQVSDIFKNYDTSLQSAELSRRSGVLGYNEKEFGLEKSKAETGDKNQKLDIMAQQYGLDREKLKLNLDQGLANLGYQQYMNTGDLLDKIDSSNAQEAAVARQILESVLQSGHAFNSGAVGDHMKTYGIGGR